MENRNRISCEEIQLSLLTWNTGKLEGLIEQHLRSCEKCRQFQQLLIDISDSSQITEEENLHPDARILISLKKNFKARTTTSAEKQTGNLFNLLITLFRKRIPVYQVMLAVFIAGIIYFSFTEINFFKADFEEPNLRSQSGKQTIQPVEFPMQQQLDQNHQIGKSLAEDSLMAKFRVSVL